MKFPVTNCAFQVLMFINRLHHERHTAWFVTIFRDNVVWDEEQEKEAEEKVLKNSKNKVPDEMKGLK